MRSTMRPQSLEKFYPQLREVKLLDYKVRCCRQRRARNRKVRVLIESGDHKRINGVQSGVSENIMEASWQALADSIDYKLLADRSLLFSLQWAPHNP